MGEIAAFENRQAGAVNLSGRNESGYALNPEL